MERGGDSISLASGDRLPSPPSVPWLNKPRRARPASAHIISSSSSSTMTMTSSRETDDSSDDDSLSYGSVASTSSAPTRSSSNSSFRTTIAAHDEKDRAGFPFYEEDEDADAQVLYMPNDLAGCGYPPSPTTPPAVKLVPPRTTGQMHPYAHEHFSYTSLNSVGTTTSPQARSRSSRHGRLHTPPPLYTHTCRVRAKYEHDASWRRVRTQLTLEQELRCLMDQQLHEVLRKRGIPPPDSTSLPTVSMSASLTSLKNQYEYDYPNSRSNSDARRSTGSLLPTSRSPSRPLSTPPPSRPRLKADRTSLAATPLAPSPLRRSTSRSSSVGSTATATAANTTTTTSKPTSAVARIGRWFRGGGSGAGRNGK